MFDSATLKLFAAITLFMGVTVLLRDRLTKIPWLIGSQSRSWRNSSLP